MINTKVQIPRVMALVLVIPLVNLPMVQAQQKPMNATPAQMVGALHSAFGKHENSRAVHTKGIITEGIFTPSTEAKNYSIAPHLQSASSKVTVRFSDFTGIPDISDLVGGGNPRGLAIKFHLPDGGSTDIVAHSFNGFPVATSDEFRALLLAIGKAGGQPSMPEDLNSFLDSHPIAKKFLTTQNPPSVSYGTLNYFGVNSFKFADAKGGVRFIRYQFLAMEGEKFLTAEDLAKKDANYLAKELKERLLSTSIKFALYAQLSEKGDDIENPSIAWPSDRKKILLGTIEVKKVTENTIAEDKALFFIPNNLPSGIQVADPMLRDRSRIYPVSVAERQ